MTVDKLKSMLLTYVVDMFCLYRTDKNFRDEVDERLDEACKSEIVLMKDHAPNTFLLRVALMGSARMYAEHFLEEGDSR